MVGLNRSTFHLGDAIGFLNAPGPRYDLIFCCGILYHMFDPVELILASASRTDRLFLWTHYFLDQPRLTDFSPVVVERDNLRLRLHEVTYKYRTVGKFLGGNRPRTRWMELPGILDTLAFYGLS